MSEKLPEGYGAWSIARKDAYWRAKWTPEQRAARERMRQFPPDWKEYHCKRHPDVTLLLTVEPDVLYCYLCMRSWPYSQLGKEDDERTEGDDRQRHDAARAGV